MPGLKLSQGQAHQIAKVLPQQARPKPSQHDVVDQWIALLSVDRSCKLSVADCRRLSSLLRAVCQPVGPQQQKELASIIKRLALP